MSEQPKVRVRIAVAVQPDGEWNAVGWSERDQDGALYPALDDEVAERTREPMDGFVVVHFIEAYVPLPLPPLTIEGTVTPAEEG